MSKKIKVLIAGIGGASLGTEILKSLVYARRYLIYGCDISPTAYGIYQKEFEETYVVARECYIESVIACCKRSGATWIVPGGDQPTVLLSQSKTLLEKEGIKLLANDPFFVEKFSDKIKTFEILKSLDFPVPIGGEVLSEKDLLNIPHPCIIKPAQGTGGSAMVFYAETQDESRAYATYIRNAGGIPLAQEYLSADEGEFTVGVLSSNEGKILGSMALKRIFSSKLSVSHQSKNAIISSGYTQGYIAEFPEICEQAEKIARAIKSTGPINIQGRMRKGEFIPFEINPRISASSYLRTLAGFNEIDILLQRYEHNVIVEKQEVKEGYYLRTLAEQFVPVSELNYD